MAAPSGVPHCSDLFDEADEGDAAQQDHMSAHRIDARTLCHGCYNSDNAALGFPVFLHLRTTNLPGPNSIMRSEHAQQRRFERRHNEHERMRRRRT